jgi:hypothetical protein
MGQYTNYGQKEGRSLTGPAGTTGTTTGSTTSSMTPAQAAAYLNAYPDLAAAFSANNAAYGDFNHDGKIDITDFGLGQYTNYGKAEGRSLTAPAATGRSNASISDAQLRAMYPGSAYFDPTSPVYDPHGAQLRAEIDSILNPVAGSGMDPGSNSYKQVVQGLKTAGYIPATTTNTGGTTTSGGLAAYAAANTDLRDEAARTVATG